MHWLLAALLGGLLANALWYVLATIAVGAAAIVAVHFLFFSLAVSLSKFNSASLSGGFEYSLHRQWLSSLIYLILGILLLIEVVVGWQLSWFGGWLLVLPLLILLLFAVVMSIVAARRFRGRHNRLAGLRSAMNKTSK